MLKKSIAMAFAIISVVFTFIPESFFSVIQWPLAEFIANCSLFCGKFQTAEVNIVFNRILCLLAAWILSVAILWVASLLHCPITIKGQDYTIKVKFGDLLKEKKGKRVIHFDECFTTTIGEAPADIKEESICGRYLNQNPNLPIDKLIAWAQVKPEETKSRYQSKDRYKSGTIVPNGDDLLMAFVPLDEDGLGVFPSAREYLDSLSTLWKGLDKYYCKKDVYIPVFGSGITRIGDGLGKHYSQQDCLNMIIWSYKMSPYKIKKPAKLVIVCKRNEEFSLDKIDSK